MPAQDRHADGLDRRHLGPDQRQQQVEVVDHQIVDHADVGGTAGERTDALGLDEFRLHRVSLQLFKGGIESFDVADLKQCLLAACQARPAPRPG